VLSRGTSWHLQRILKYIKYIIFEFSPQPFSFISPLLPIEKYFQQVTFFLSSCTQFLSHIHPLTPFHHLLPPLSIPCYQSPQGEPDPSSCSLILQKKGKMNNIIVCLRWLHREFPCSTSMYLCIFTWFSSFPLSFSFYFSPFFIVSPV
jgi:hypothetical protein